MSRVKDEMERIQQEEFERYVSFMEWVSDQRPEMSECDTNEEEEDINMPSTAEASIVHQNTLKAVNNADYNPNRSIK